MQMQRSRRRHVGASKCGCTNVLPPCSFAGYVSQRATFSPILLAVSSLLLAVLSSSFIHQGSSSSTTHSAATTTICIIGSAHALEMAHVQTDSDVITHVAFATVKCGGRITIDSLHPNMPGGSQESAHLPYYPSTTGNAGPEYVQYGMRTVAPHFARLVEDSIHTSITNVILFEIDGSTAAMGSPCDVSWDPTESWVSDVETSSVSLAVFSATPLEGLAALVTGLPSSSATTASLSNNFGLCQDVQVGFNAIPGAVSMVMPAAVGVADNLYTSVSLNTLNTRFNGYNTIPTDEVFPATILAPPQCKVIVAVIASHYGKYSALSRWLPLLIYSVLFLPLVFIVGRRGVMAGTNGGILVLGLTFVGYAGCCVGLGIELATWSYPLHPFPFPGSVTMYLLASILYGCLLIVLMWGHPLRLVATHTMFNMLLYGLSIGLMVGYFMRAFLIIGILAVGMIGLLNLVVVVMTVYFATLLPRSFRVHTGSSHVRSLAMWFPATAPVVPVSYFALQLGWTGYQSGAVKGGLNKKRHAYSMSTFDGPPAPGGGRSRSEVEQAMDAEGNDFDTNLSSGAINTSIQRNRAAAMMMGGGSARPQTDANGQAMSQLAIVNLHSILSSLLFIVLHDLSTLALLIAACIYHTPFVVAVFPTVCLTILHVAYSMQEYTKVWRLYGARGVWVSLGTAMTFYARQEAMQRQPQPVPVQQYGGGYAADGSYDVAAYYGGGHPSADGNQNSATSHNPSANNANSSNSNYLGNAAHNAAYAEMMHHQRQRSMSMGGGRAAAGTSGAAMMMGYDPAEKQFQQQQQEAYHGYSNGGRQYGVGDGDGEYSEAGGALSRQPSLGGGSTQRNAGGYAMPTSPSALSGAAYYYGEGQMARGSGDDDAYQHQQGAYQPNMRNPLPSMGPAAATTPRISLGGGGNGNARSESMQQYQNGSDGAARRRGGGSSPDPIATVGGGLLRQPTPTNPNRQPSGGGGGRLLSPRAGGGGFDDGNAMVSGINNTPPRQSPPRTALQHNATVAGGSVGRPASGMVGNGRPPTTFRTVASAQQQQGMAPSSPSNSMVMGGVGGGRSVSQQQQQFPRNASGRSGSAMLLSSLGGGY